MMLSFIKRLHFLQVPHEEMNSISMNFGLYVSSNSICSEAAFLVHVVVNANIYFLI